MKTLYYVIQNAEGHYSCGRVERTWRSGVTSVDGMKFGVSFTPTFRKAHIFKNYDVILKHFLKCAENAVPVDPSWQIVEVQLSDPITAESIMDEKYLMKVMKHASK